MKTLKSFTILFSTICLFTSCSTAQKLQQEPPFHIENVYSQKWVAGIEGGGSGINLFIPISKEISQNIELDSVYFRGKGVKLELIKGEKPMYIGRFETDFNQKKDIIMSSDPNEEYGNEVLPMNNKIPFKLEDTECVVSFKDQGDIKYFKIENITEKPNQNYPSAPSNKQE